MNPKPTPTGRRTAFVAAALVLVATWGCGVAGARNPFAEATPAETRISIWVENRGFNDIRLYAATPRGNQSLGSVGGNTQRRIDLEWRQLDQLSFRIEVLAGRTYNTMGVSVQPGDRIQVVIPEDPNQTYIQVR